MAGFQDAARHYRRSLTACAASDDRPVVTLSLARSLDGSIALVAGTRAALSSEESLRFTHSIRAVNDGILVGVATVIADDPRLSTRRVAGASPRPVVLDRALRVSSQARILSRNPLILHGPNPDAGRALRLRDTGAELVGVALDASGLLDLKQVAAALRRAGIARLMVEGGARVHAAFFGAGLFDIVVTTVVPQVWDGYRIPSGDGRARFPMRDLRSFQLGGDQVWVAARDRGAA